MPNRLKLNSKHNVKNIIAILHELLQIFVWFQLSLAYNQLGSLETHLLGHWDTLEYFDIAGNAWVCDCENQWMVSSLLPTVEKFLRESTFQLDDDKQ